MARNSYLIALGRNVAAARKDRKLTQEELAGRADLGVPHLSDIERGVTNPTVLTLRTVAKALGISTSELLPDYVDKGADAAMMLRGRTDAERRRAVAVLAAMFGPQT